MKNKTQVLDFLKRYSIITLGCIIYSFGVSLFLDTSNLAAGGVTGIAIMLNYVIHLGGLDPKILDAGTLMIIINIPLFILGAIFFGKKFILSTLYSTVLSSALIALWSWLIVPHMPVPAENESIDLLIPAVVGGVLYGAGLGLIFRMGSTTGGTDIITKILRKKFRHLKTGIISVMIDAVIVGVSAFVYKDFSITFYTIISLIVFTIAFDFVLYGGNSAKFVYIVTTADKCAAICDYILKELDISATLVDGKGAYTGNERTIIMCAVKNVMFPRLRDIIKDVDPNAFTIVTNAQEIYGEGYKPHGGEEL